MSKMILITGATGNLGTAVCKAFHDAGYQVIGTRLPDSGETSAFAELIDLDLLNEEMVSQTVEQLKSTNKTIHGLICLAGGFAMSNIQNTSSDDLKKMYELNFLTAYHVARPIHQWMSEQKGGRIVLTGAKPAVEGGGYEVLPYALSKGNVIQFAQVLNEMSNKTGVVTSVIVPSIIDTPPNRSAMPDADFDAWVKPEAIAAQILHLMSEGSSVLRQPLMKIYGRS